MSRENVEVVRRVFDATARRDSTAVMAFYDPNVEWEMRSATVTGGLVGQGVYHGHSGVRKFFRDFQDAWERVRYTVDELIDAGEHVVVVMTIRGRGRTSRIEVEVQDGGVWTLRDGKVARVVWFGSREEALEAVGLSE